MKSNSNLDSILIEIGEFGKYQRCLILLLMFSSMLRYFPAVIFIFETTQVNHRCKINECDYGSTEYNPVWLANAVPFKNGKPEKCSKFKKINGSSCEASSFDTSVLETCNTFVYETSQNSIMQDFDLHCDDNLKALTLVGTMNAIARFIGLPIAGFISDMYGRKTVLISVTIMSAILGLVRSVSTSYAFFMVSSFLESFFSASAYPTIYTLALEFVGPKHRSLVSSLLFTSFGLGSLILGSAAWLLQSWRTLVQVLYGLYSLVVAFYLFVPESVRWLLTKNRHEEAIKILRKMAQVNEKTISKGQIENLLHSNADVTKVKNPITDLFKSSKLLVRFCLCSFCWISCILVYYGLTIVSTTLSQNKYLDFILTSVIESPANILCYFLLNKGRKTTFLIALVTCCISSLAYVVIPVDTYWVKLVMYLIGKFGITISFATIYIITNETFPTPVRQTALSLCSMFGRIGSILAPQLILLVDIWTHLPLIIFASATGISSIITLLLPETIDAKLPDTLEDAENVGREIQRT